MAAAGRILRASLAALVVVSWGAGCVGGGQGSASDEAPIEADNGVGASDGASGPDGQDSTGPDPAVSTTGPTSQSTPPDAGGGGGADELGPDEYQVPVAKGLVEALPVFRGESKLHTDEVFDVRLCDGSEAVDVPIDHGAVTFVDGPVTTTAAVYQFVEGYAAAYAMEYVDSLLTCATPTSVVETLELGEDSYLFTIDDGTAPILVLVVVDRDWMWLVQRRSAAPPPTFTADELVEIQAAIEA